MSPQTTLVPEIQSSDTPQLQQKSGNICTTLGTSPAAPPLPPAITTTVIPKIRKFVCEADSQKPCYRWVATVTKSVVPSPSKGAVYEIAVHVPGLTPVTVNMSVYVITRNYVWLYIPAAIDHITFAQQYRLPVIFSGFRLIGYTRNAPKRLAVETERAVEKTA
ncbi:MAG: hypothetical protein ACP5IE_06795 [Infirmifilum sp.]